MTIRQYKSGSIQTRFFYVLFLSNLPLGAAGKVADDLLLGQPGGGHLGGEELFDEGEGLLSGVACDNGPDGGRHAALGAPAR